MRPRHLGWFNDLPVFWKLLVPFLTLMLITGLLGAVVVVRDLGTRAQTTLDQDLSRRALDIRAFAHDRELYLLESANFAANLQGMPEAARARDDHAVSRLLESVLALKTDLNLLVATDTAGTSVSEFTRTSGGAPPAHGIATAWEATPFVRAALASTSGDRTSGLLPLGGDELLAIAAPICSAAEGCAPTGVAIAGIRLAALAALAHVGRAGVAVYALEGRRIATRGGTPRSAPTATTTGPMPRLRQRIGGIDTETLFSPLTIQGNGVATVAVTLPTAQTFASVRHAGQRFALVLLLAMAGIVAIGAALSRRILAQVRPLVTTNRAIGTGDLGARAPVLGRDELGEVAAGINAMAEQLQASYGELERRVAERTEELSHLYGEVVAASEAKSQFFAAVSHEFRTPLFAILAHAELAADPDLAPDDAGELRDYLQSVGASANMLLERVNEMLDLARSEAGELHLARRRVDLAQLFSELAPQLVALGRRSSVTVAVDAEPGTIDLDADPSRLAQIVLNLVSNGIKHTPPGGQVDVSARRHGRCVELTVADTGTGIPPEVGDRIFEPYYQVDGPSAMLPSSGLGLSITKRLVEAHGGSIGYTSAPGAGATFLVSFPRAASRNGGRRRVSRSELEVSA